MERYIKLGIDTTTTNSCMELTENEVLEKLERSREHVAQGMYRDADDVVFDMRAKYGL